MLVFGTSHFLRLLWLRTARLDLSGYARAALKKSVVLVVAVVVVVVVVVVAVVVGGGVGVVLRLVVVVVVVSVFLDTVHAVVAAVVLGSLRFGMT